jgi:Zn-dependent peptidase ImmA (M78 family)
MIDTLETYGILVIVMHEEDAGKFDGLAGTVGNKPMISISQHWSGDRQRFTLAHELGHIVLQGRLAKNIDEEKACNRFAGAFLLPQQAVHNHFGQHRTALESQELYLLKHEFGLSMAGCLFRLLQCGIINQSLFTHWQRLFSQYGWRKREPYDPYPSEKTILFKQLVYQALAEEYLTESKAAELLGMSTIAFHQQRKLEMTNADTD